MSSTHVKIGNWWLSVSELDNTDFIEKSDGSIFGRTESGKEYDFSGITAADLRAWLAGKPDNAVAEQVDTSTAKEISSLRAVVDDMADIYREWLNSDAPTPFKDWLHSKYHETLIASIFLDAYKTIYLSRKA